VNSPERRVNWVHFVPAIKTGWRSLDGMQKKGENVAHTPDRTKTEEA
jgi:hypothetical protein